MLLIPNHIPALVVENQETVGGIKHAGVGAVGRVLSAFGG
jgi:hypothetical protein